MASLSIKSLQANICKVIDSQVGDAIPSVLLARGKNPKLPHPFATVDVLNVNTAGIGSVSRYNESAQGVEHFFLHDIMVSISIYDSVKGGDALMLAQELCNKLHTDNAMTQFLTLVGCKILDIGDIMFSGDYINNSFEEAAKFNFRVDASSSYVDTATGVIEKIESDGAVDDEEKTFTSETDGD